MSEATESNPLEQVRSILFDGKFEAIAARLEELDRQHTARTDTVLQEVRERLVQLEQAGAAREQALREVLSANAQSSQTGLAQIRALLADEKTSGQAQFAALAEDLSRVRESKPDRHDLSSMLMDVAQRLKKATPNG